MNNTPNFEEVVAGTVQKALGKDANTKVFNSIYEDLMDNYQVHYRRQDDFTVALLVDKTSPADDTDHVFVGVSKRNPIDRASPLRGRALALSRAVRRVVESRLRGEKEEAPSPLKSAVVAKLSDPHPSLPTRNGASGGTGFTPYTPRT